VLHLLAKLIAVSVYSMSKTGPQEIDPADVHITLSWPTPNVIAQHLCRVLARVRTPVLPSAGGDVAGHQGYAGFEVQHCLLAGVEQINVEDIGIDTGIERVFELDLKAGARVWTLDLCRGRLCRQPEEPSQEIRQQPKRDTRGLRVVVHRLGLLSFTLNN
jgi:hypothetical protein